MKGVRDTTYGRHFRNAVRQDLTDKEYRKLKRHRARRVRYQGHTEVRQQLQDAA